MNRLYIVVGISAISCGGNVLFDESVKPTSEAASSIDINPSGGEGGTLPSEPETINKIQEPDLSFDVPNYSQYDIIFNFGSQCYTVQSEDPEFIASLPKEIEGHNSLWLYTYIQGETCFEISDDYSNLDEFPQYELVREKAFGNLWVEEYSYSSGCSLCQIVE